MSAEKCGLQWKRSGVYLAMGVVERSDLDSSSGNSSRDLVLGGKVLI
jgi:hypothetical protein